MSDLHSSLLIHFLLLPVLIPNGKYNGQKLMKLVITKIAASAIRTIPNVPVITCVKNKTAITTATSILITLSIVPMFLFIFSFLAYN